MSNLSKKRIKLKIEDKDYIMSFDMKSIEVFKEMTNESFILSTSKLISFDDETVINYMACTIRPADNEEEPIGKEIYEMNLLNLLLNYSGLVIQTVLEELPKSEGEKPKKKMKKIT